MAHVLNPSRHLSGLRRILLGAAMLVGLTAHGLARQAAATDPTSQAAPATQAADPREAALAEAFKAMQAAKITGPAEVKLRDQATLQLPAGYIWVPEPAAGQYMRAMGNRPDERGLGLIFPQSDKDNWLIVAEYDPAGYIKDDDAKNWDIDEMFTSLQDGTEAANEERRRQGFPELEIVGWVEKPAYDAGTHRLVWSMSARNKGSAQGGPLSINYNTYALGREGFISLNLITDTQAIETDKRHAHTLLAALAHEEGKRYADFDASTDKVAEYGLAALVGGFAAKKLGMFAVLAAFLAKFGKVLVFGAAALAAVAARLFKKKKAA